MLKFKQEWGHCDVPQKYDQRPKLSNCVSDQRIQYRPLKSGKKSFTNNDRIAQLEDVEFQWTFDSQLIQKTARNEIFSELLKFKQKWGHCYDPQKYAKNPKISNWENHQRKQYRLLKSGKKSFIKN